MLFSPSSCRSFPPKASSSSTASTKRARSRPARSTKPRACSQRGAEIWRGARTLGIPITDAGAPNGTPQMAREVQRLYRETTFSSLGVLAMGGHEDGVIAIGRTAGEAGECLVRHLARALG